MPRTLTVAFILMMLIAMRTVAQETVPPNDPRPLTGPFLPRDVPTDPAPPFAPKDGKKAGSASRPTSQPASQPAPRPAIGPASRPASRPVSPGRLRPVKPTRSASRPASRPVKPKMSMRQRLAELQKQLREFQRRLPKMSEKDQAKELERIKKAFFD